MAAPLMPMCNGQMKMGSRMVFNTTVTMVAIIAARGLLAERKAAFRPRYRCVTTLPTNRINM